MKDGYILNPDEEFVRNLKKRIKSNGGYCLNKEKNTKDNKCPCLAFEEKGVCDCGLYICSYFDEPQWDN